MLPLRAFPSSHLFPPILLFVIFPNFLPIIIIMQVFRLESGTDSGSEEQGIGQAFHVCSRYKYVMLVYKKQKE